MAQKAHSLSHTKWMCKYHIVLANRSHFGDGIPQAVDEILKHHHWCLFFQMLQSFNSLRG